MIMILNYVGVIILIYGIITGMRIIASELKELSKKSKK